MPAPKKKKMMKAAKPKAKKQAKKNICEFC